jgi:hypothetical protein
MLAILSAHAEWMCKRSHHIAHKHIYPLCCLCWHWHPYDGDITNTVTGMHIFAIASAHAGSIVIA